MQAHELIIAADAAVTATPTPWPVAVTPRSAAAATNPAMCTMIHEAAISTGDGPSHTPMESAEAAKCLVQQAHHSMPPIDSAQDL
jgi:hypothetical protein